MVDRKSDWTLMSAAELLFESQETVNEAFLKCFRWWRQQVKDVEDGSNDFHLRMLLEESERDWLPCAWLHNRVNLIKKTSSNLNLEVAGEQLQQPGQVI